MRASLRTRIEPLLRAPTPGLPAGADWREDPRYAAFSDQRARFEAGQPVNWPDIRQLGARVLTELVKECVSAAYVAYAELQAGGLSGLAQGAALLAALIEEQWETLQPPRERARVNAVTWFLERSQAALAGGAASASGADEARAGLAWLEEVTRARLGSQAPSCAPLLALIPAQGGASPPVPQATPPAPPPPPPPPAAAAAPPPAAPAERPAARWLAPIPGDAPAGQNARYDARYEQARQEIDKLQAAAGAPPDFAKVRELTGDLLATTTKDLLMASYLAGALGAVSGLPGWSTGLDLLAGVMEGFWLTMYPEATRIRARANALGWFVDFALPRLSSLAPAAGDRAAVEVLATRAKALVEVSSRCFQGEGPSLRPMLEAIERLKLSLPAEAPPPPPPPPAAPPPPSASAAPAPAPAVALEAPSASFEDLAGLSAFLSKVGASLTPAARAIRAAASGDPQSYRLLRVGLWLHLLQLPPANQGKTSIPAPPPALRKKLEQLLASGNWAVLLDESESALEQHRLWLDLNHFTDRALEGLGGAHAAARAAVRAQVAELVTRHPGLVDLKYPDGTGLAGDAARAYLLSAGAAKGDAAPAAEAQGDKLEGARALVTEGKLAEALAQVEGEARRAASGSDAFELRLHGAELARSAGQVALARALFAQLDQEAQARGLDGWAPKLAARHLGGYARALQALLRDGKDPGAGADLRRALERLARIDPGAVLMILSP